MTHAPETHFEPRDRAAFLHRVAKSPVVGLWRWEVVDEVGTRIRDCALVRFANGSNWVGDLPWDAFPALRRSLGQMPAREPLKASACPVKRRPRLTLRNAHLLLILGMLVGACWMAFFDGEPEPGLFLAVAVPVGFMWAVTLLNMGSWRSRVTWGEGRLRVFEGRNPEPTHDLARTELSDLWLREVYPTERQAVIHRGTANTLYLMARTHDGQAHAVLCLRNGVLTCRNRGAVLAWVETVLGRNGVGVHPEGPHQSAKERGLHA